MAKALGKKVLVCPLNWGLGHATRDVQLIEELINQGFEVMIGAHGAPLSFLTKQFPALACISMPSFVITYPTHGSMMIKMFFSVPKILLGIVKEHRQLKKIIQENKINIVISDNRYGLWNRNVYCIFISHMLWVITPFRFKLPEKILNRINHWFIGKYNECWVPDVENPQVNLSGKLAHFSKMPVNARYIGILSRFRNYYKQLADRQQPSNNPKYDIVALVSGPEPQRSIFENILINQISGTGYKALMVLGKPSEINKTTIENIECVSHIETKELEKLMIETPIIISRTGYSTIMDLVRLNKQAILIPTPGQTEQEYLAELMLEKKWFYTVSQKEFDFNKALKQVENYKPYNFGNKHESLLEAIGRIV